MDIVGKIVRVRMNRTFAEQRLWVFVGRVVEFTENWVVMEGKGLIVLKRATLTVEIDETSRTIVIPRQSIFVIRVLPDTFDMDNILAVNVGHKLCLKVPGGPDATIADMSEV